LRLFKLAIICILVVIISEGEVSQAISIQDILVDQIKKAVINEGAEKAFIKYNKDIDKKINTSLKAIGITPPEFTKCVPVYNMSGVFVGAGQVYSAKKETLNKVQALLQVDGDVANVFRFRIFVPTTTKEPDLLIKKAYRTPDINVSAVIDVNL